MSKPTGIIRESGRVRFDHQYQSTAAAHVEAHSRVSSIQSFSGAAATTNILYSRILLNSKTQNTKFSHSLFSTVQPSNLHTMGDSTLTAEEQADFNLDLVANAGTRLPHELPPRQRS
jgi:hypothetical protein